ncbi:MAG: hypothetical protein Q9183_008089, partial [Haloplaca sp. 2 TL-2023]
MIPCRGRGRGRASISQDQGRGTYAFPGSANGQETRGAGQQASRGRGVHTLRGRGVPAPRARGSESQIPGHGRGTGILLTSPADESTRGRRVTNHRGRASTRGHGQVRRPDDRISLEQYLATHPLDEIPVIRKVSEGSESSQQYSDPIAISPSSQPPPVNHNETAAEASSEQADRRISTTPPSTTLPPPQPTGSRADLTSLDSAMATIKINVPANLESHSMATGREENIGATISVAQPCNETGNSSPLPPLALIPDSRKRDRAMALIDYDATDEHHVTFTRERANEGKGTT